MIYVSQIGDSYSIRFKYDARIVDIVRNVPGRIWEPSSKQWLIPTSKLGVLIKLFNDSPFKDEVVIQSAEDLNKNATLDSTDKTAIPNIDISDIKQYVVEGGSLYSHQLDFLKYAKNHGRKGFILADDMGCISGDAIIDVVIGKREGRTSLRGLFEYWKSNDSQYSEIFVRCYREDIGDFVYNRIRSVKFSGVKPVYAVRTYGGLELTATGDHEFLTVDRGYTELLSLSTGDKLVTFSSSDEALYDEIVDIRPFGEQMTYDIVMQDPYRNFVANGIVVHNCGKTLELLNYAMYQRQKFGYKHCLIIACINCAKYSWLDDIQKHTNGAEVPYILGSRPITRGRNKGKLNYNKSSEEKLADLQTGHMYGDENAPELPYFLIINVESLRAKQGKKYTIGTELANQILRQNISMIIIDECHKNMSPTSIQGKVILDIYKRCAGQGQWIPTTGTPIRNKPTDVFTPLKLVGGHAINSYYRWKQQFCIFGGYEDHEILGYKNIPLLKTMLQGHMIRRNKSDVLDLPPKVYHVEYVENTPYQQKLYDSIREHLLEDRESILGSMNPLAHMLRLRQVTGSPELVDDSIKIDNSYLKKNAKLTRLMELVEDITAQGEKVLIFSNWVQPLRTIYRFLSTKYRVCTYTGTMSGEERERSKNLFIKCPECKIMLGTIGAMGASVTLTVANNVIFYDDCWTPSDKEQAEDRCYRIGTNQTVNVYTLIAKDTIDERVYKILDDKRHISNYIVDGKLDLKQNPSLFEFLLGCDLGVPIK